MSTESTSSTQSTSPQQPQPPTSAAPSFLPTNIRFVLITVFLDILGIGLIIPVLPRLVASFTTQPDMQAYWYGLIVAIYGVMQFFCAPIIGALSDRFGRRPVLLICVFGLGLNFLLMTLATSIFWLLFVRALGGVTAGNLSVASAYIADSSAPSERSKALGKIGAMFGLGFICGPVLGGVLGKPAFTIRFIWQQSSRWRTWCMATSLCQNPCRRLIANLFL